MTEKKMTAPALCLAFLLTVPIACSSAPSGPNLKDGRWEISSKLEMTPMPFHMPPVTFTQCLSRTDYVPQQTQTDGPNPCTLTDNKVKDDTVSWTMVCDTPNGKSSSTGSITYHGDSFEGVIKIEAGNSMPEMTQRMSGRRIGNCD